MGVVKLGLHFGGVAPRLVEAADESASRRCLVSSMCPILTPATGVFLISR